MEAIALLKDVAARYRRLRTLDVRATALVESGDHSASQSSRQQISFQFAAPDKFRFESAGRNGFLQVSDGDQVLTRFPGPRYFSVFTAEISRPLHHLRPEFPLAGGDEPFLFPAIASRVREAHILRQEDGCHVVSVAYEHTPLPPHLLPGPPALFWIDPNSLLVMRQYGEYGFLQAAEPEPYWSRHTIIVDTISPDIDIPAETFRFVPPPGAHIESGGSGGAGVTSSRGPSRP